MKKRIIAVLMMLTMVVTLLPAGKAKAATVAYLYNKKKPTTILTEKKTTAIYVGGAKINLDYNIGGKIKGVSGKWSSSDTDIITVDKNGSCKAVGNGTAVITFKYTDPLTKEKNRVLKTKLKAYTRASGITLVPAQSLSTDTDGTSVLKLKPGYAASFGTKLTTNAKALAVNPEVVTTYGSYFELFQDEACTIPAGNNIVTVMDSGIINAIAPGTVYLRAVGKNTQNATAYNVYSSPVKIVVAEEVSVVQSDNTKFKINSPSSDILMVTVKNSTGGVVTQLGGSPVIAADKRSAVVSVGSSLLGKYTVIVTTTAETVSREIECENIKVADIRFTSAKASITGDSKNGLNVATVNYRLYDQFGNDVTNNPLFPYDQFLAVWVPDNGDGNEKATVVGPGTIELGLKTSTLGATGTIKIIHAYGQTATAEQKITVGLNATISSVEIVGLFSCSVDTAGNVKYTKVLDENVCSLFAGNVIYSSSGLNNFPNAYYLLLRVFDTDGNAVNSKGVSQQRLFVTMSGAGLEIDGKESIEGINIDGQTYLTYAVKGTTVKKDSLIIQAYAPNNSQEAYKVILKSIPGEMAIGSFTIENGKTCTLGQAVYVNYDLRDSSNNQITDFENVVRLTTGNAPASSEVYVTLPDTTIKSTIATVGGGTAKSMFAWEKDMETGNAKLRYFPLGIGVDTIVTFQGKSYSTTVTYVITAASN